jgi:hypothetical protein
MAKSHKPKMTYTTFLYNIYITIILWLESLRYYYFTKLSFDEKSECVIITIKDMAIKTNLRPCMLGKGICINGTYVSSRAEDYPPLIHSLAEDY